MKRMNCSNISYSVYHLKTSPPPLSSPLKGEEMRCCNTAPQGEEFKEDCLTLKGEEMKRISRIKIQYRF